MGCTNLKSYFGFKRHKIIWDRSSPNTKLRILGLKRFGGPKHNYPSVLGNSEIVIELCLSIKIEKLNSPFY